MPTPVHGVDRGSSRTERPLAGGRSGPGQAEVPRDDIKTVGMLSLGCPKNLVDGEVMLGRLQGAGYRWSPTRSRPTWSW